MITIQKAFRLMFALLPLVLGSGCATHTLWTTAELNDCNGPAPDARLRIFRAGPKAGLVVVYDEYSERHDSIGTRAYLPDKNLTRIEERRPPRFVSTNGLGALTPVPLFATTNLAIPAPDFYAVVSTNHISFTLYSGGSKIQTYSLPVYDDGKGRVEKIALTPLTAAADATIVGGVLGTVVVWAMCESGETVPHGKWR